MGLRLQASGDVPSWPAAQGRRKEREERKEKREGRGSGKVPRKRRRPWPVGVCWRRDSQVAGLLFRGGGRERRRRINGKERGIKERGRRKRKEERVGERREERKKTVGPAGDRRS